MKNNNSHKQPGLRLPLLPAPPRPRAPGLAPPDGAAREGGPARDEAVSPCPGRAVGAQFPAQMPGLGAPLRHTCGLSTPPPGRAGAAPQVRGGSCTPRPRGEPLAPAADAPSGASTPGTLRPRQPRVPPDPAHPSAPQREPRGARPEEAGRGRGAARSPVSCSGRASPAPPGKEKQKPRG